MAEPTRTCPRCQRVVLESRFVDSSCPVCVAETEGRKDPTPGRWAPASLGTLSLFVNPVFVTSVMTIGRARDWLRWAEEREYSPWHAQIRSSALWGIVLATFQPILIGVLLTMSLAFHAEPVPPTPAAVHDERAEILALLESDLPMARLVGLCQLDETGVQPEDRARVEATIRRADESTRPTVEACGALALAALDDVPVQERFLDLSNEARSAMLDELGRRDDPRRFELLAMIGPL